MSSRPFRAVAAAAFALCVAGGAWAQGAAQEILKAHDANPMGLLLRSEVQNEINLDLKQRNALQALADKAGLNGRPASQGGVMTMQDLQRLPREQQLRFMAELRSLPPAERARRLQAMQAASRQQQQVQSGAAWEGELTQPVKDILRPEQITRLHELDLQKRGAFALGDPRVAQEVKLSPEHQQKVAGIVSAADGKRREVIARAYQKWNQSGSNPRTAPDLKSKLSPDRQKIDAIDKQATADVLAVLSPEEAARWQAAQGKKLAFRID